MRPNQNRHLLLCFNSYYENYNIISGIKRVSLTSSFDPLNMPRCCRQISRCKTVLNQYEEPVEVNRAKNQQANVNGADKGKTQVYSGKEEQAKVHCANNERAEVNGAEDETIDEYQATINAAVTALDPDDANRTEEQADVNGADEEQAVVIVANEEQAKVNGASEYQTELDGSNE